MKDTLKRMLGISPAPAQAESSTQVEQPAQADSQKEPEMTTNTQAEGLAAVTASLEAMAGQLATLKADNDALKAALNAATNDAQTKKFAAREADAVASLGTEHAPAFLAATKDLPDATFDSVMAAMKMKTADEAKSEMFSEKGVSGKSDASKVADEDSGLMKILKAKYQVAK